MKKSVSHRLICLAMFAVGAFVFGGASNVVRAQSSSRIMDSGNVPPVDLPTPMEEAELFPEGVGGNVELSTPSYDDYAETMDSQPMPVDSSIDSAIESSVTDPGFDDGFVMGDYLDNGCGNGLDYQQPAPIYSTGTWWNRGRWFTQMEVMVLNRDDDFSSTAIGSVPIVANGAALTVEELAAQRYAPGTRMTLGRFLGRDTSRRDHTVEFAFMGLFDWSATTDVQSRSPLGTGDLTSGLNGSVAIDNLVTPFQTADRMAFTYDADFNDFQMNYKISSRPGRDVLALQPNGQWIRTGVSSQMMAFFGGLRYSSINDQTLLTAQFQQDVSQSLRLDGVDNTTTTTNVTEVDAQRGRYTVNTHNDLFGVHIGGELENKFDDWSWGLRGKVGGLVNLVDRRTEIISRTRDAGTVTTRTEQSTNDLGQPLFNEDDGMGGMIVTTSPTDGMGNNNTPILDTITDTVFNPVDEVETQKISDDTFSLLLEAGLFGKYQLRPNLLVRGGYDVILYSNVGFSPENMGFQSRFPALDINGTALFHGGYVGFEASW